MSSKSNKLAAGAALGPVLFFVMALSGCGYSGADLCDDTCDCKGCSNVEYDNCVDDANDFERQVDKEGCYDFYDDYMACSKDEFACQAGKVDLDGCEQEQARLFNCLK